MPEKFKNEKFEKIIGDNPKKAIRDAIRSLESLEGESLGMVGVSGLIDYSAHMGYIGSWEAENYRLEVMD